LYHGGSLKKIHESFRHMLMWGDKAYFHLIDKIILYKNFL
jgi:hypothetical protein